MSSPTYHSSLTMAPRPTVSPTAATMAPTRQARSQPFHTPNAENEDVAVPGCGSYRQVLEPSTMVDGSPLRIHP
jgi:hypothetical protein